ncbi:MAG: DUF5615 family PIN-like protein [bacterium]
MNLLFDESVPFSLRDAFLELDHDHSVTFAEEEGWGGLKNGELLREASHTYDIFITCDQDLVHQRNLEKYEIGVIVLKRKTNRRKDLEPHLPQLLKTLQTANISTYEEIG